MAPVLLHARQHVPDLSRHLAVALVLDQLGIARGGVQGRAQLVTHAGQKFRFGLASTLKLVVERLQLLRGLALVRVQAGQFP